MPEDSTASMHALAERARQALKAADRSPPQLQWVAETESTNSDLLAAGCPPDEGLARVAERQTAGRGRLGRVWQSRAGGSLCLSIALPWPGGVARAAGASLVAGLAVAETLRAHGADEVGLKWPNDLWARGRKLGGLLVEVGGRGDAVFLVVGVGLNLDLPGDFEAGLDWIDLAALGLSPDRAGLVAALLLQLRARLRQMQDQGLAELLPAWQHFDVLRGCAVQMLSGDQRWPGHALGLADDGGLRVEHADGERVWHSGEASLRPA